MKRLLRFVWLRIRRTWRDARGLSPYPLPPWLELFCAICGRKQRLWEEPFVSVVGMERDGLFWVPDYPHDDPYLLKYFRIRDVRAICYDHGGKSGRVIIDASTGDEVQIPPYRRRTKVYRAFREVAWWVQVVARFAGWSLKEIVFFVFYPKRYAYWAKLLGGWW